MADGCGTKLARCILFFVNFLIWFGCFCLVASGITMLVSSTIFESIFAEAKIPAIAAFLIMIGGFGFIVGFSGCCGVLTNNTCLLKTYVVLMFVVVLGEIVGGALLLVYKDDVEASMTEGMTDAIKYDYGLIDAATEAVDVFQYVFECCGAKDPIDYVGSHFRMVNGPAALPDTCCLEGIDPGTCTRFTPGVFNEGCVPVTAASIADSIMIVGLMCFAVISLQVITMSLACYLFISVGDSANYAYKNFS